MPTDHDLKPADALRKRAKEERRLLLAEQEAERDLLEATERLAAAQTRLEKAQKLVHRRRQSVAKALAELRQRQEARAVGPDAAAVPAESEQPVPESLPAAVPARDDLPVPLEVETPPVADSATATDNAKPPRRTAKRRSDTPPIPA